RPAVSSAPAAAAKQEAEQPALAEGQRGLDFNIPAQPAMRDQERLESAPSPVAPAPGRIVTRERTAYLPLSGGAPQPSLRGPDVMPPQPEFRDRVENFDTNPLRSTVENPVSTFSID